MNILRIITVCAAIAFVPSVAVTYAADMPKAAATSTITNAKEYNVDSDKLAIAGYDPVSYFKGGPVEGKKEFNLTVDGIMYRFSSDENLKEFAANPAKYKPAYGGWCATAMSDGRKVEIDAKNYKITSGRLFLFFKSWYANAINDWNKDEKNKTVKADASWKKISGE
jgi:YHS domain-containing protein